MSSLYDEPRGLLKILQVLMNMDLQLQPIISCYAAELTRDVFARSAT